MIRISAWAVAAACFMLAGLVAAGSAFSALLLAAAGSAFSALLLAADGSAFSALLLAADGRDLGAALLAVLLSAYCAGSMRLAVTVGRHVVRQYRVRFGARLRAERVAREAR